LLATFITTKKHGFEKMKIYRNIGGKMLTQV